MKRTLGALALFGIALAWLPMAGAQVGVSVDGESLFESDLLDDVTSDVPALQIDAGPLRIETDLGGQTNLGGSDDASAPDAETDGSPTSGSSLMVPSAGTGLAAAGAVTGLAVLAGLVAHQWGTLKVLAGSCLIGLFSRIDHNRMLDNDVRHRVHEAVANNPGVTIKEITAIVGCGWGTAVYHLKRLEAERLVVSERSRQFRRYFRNGGGISNDVKSAFSELKNPTSHKIAQRLVASPGACQKDLCASLGISAPLASKYLSRLKDAGLVSTERDWKLVKYYPTPRLEDLLEGARGTDPFGPAKAAAPSPLVVVA